MNFFFSSEIFYFSLRFASLRYMFCISISLSNILLKKVVLNSNHLVSNVPKVAIIKQLSNCKNHHSNPVGKLPVYTQLTRIFITCTVIPKSHANLDRPTMIVRKNTDNNATNNHIINNVRPMALFISTNSHRNIQSTLKSYPLRLATR